MTKTTTWLSRRRGGLALGLALSLAVGALYLTALLDRLDNLGLDLHFRFLSNIPADPRIVMIDIDDQSLAALGAWPWPRRHYADLVNTLHELHAHSIVLDVILAEPNPPRVEHAALTRDYDLDMPLAQFGDPAADRPIFDDDELRDAIKTANVYLPMYSRLAPPTRPSPFSNPNTALAAAPFPSALDQALDLLRSQPAITADQLSKSIDLPPDLPAQRLLIQARIVRLLEADFALDETAVVAALGGDRTATLTLVRENFSTSKRLAARRAARRFFQDSPLPTWPAFLSSALASAPPGADPEIPIPSWDKGQGDDRASGGAGKTLSQSPLSLSGRGQGERVTETLSPTGRRGLGEGALEQPLDGISADRNCLIDAFRTERARRAVAGKAIETPIELAGHVQRAYDVAYPLDKFAEAAGGVGFVAFGRGDSSGVLRSVPMVVDVGGSLIPQLGLLAAMDILGVQSPSFAYENDSLVITVAPEVAIDPPRRASPIAKGESTLVAASRAALARAEFPNSPSRIGTYSPSQEDISLRKRNAEVMDSDRGSNQLLRVPTDRNGRTLINWHVPRSSAGPRDWRDSFVHIPAAAVLEISRSRRTLDDNRRRLALAKSELLELRHADTRAQFARYVDLVRNRDRMAESASPNPARPGGDGGPPILAEVQAQIREMEDEAVAWLRRAESLWQGEVPRDDTERTQRARIHRLYQWFNDSALAARLAGADRTLESRISERRAALASQITNRVCLVGYTASGVADLVATPVHSQAPGVIAHANIMNMALQNRFVSLAPLNFNLTFIVLAGLAGTIASCAGGWRGSLVGALGAVVASMGCGAFLFRYTAIHSASISATSAIAFVWSGVTLYRQSTEERARRRLHRALTQYTSPAIAVQIAERFDRAALTPQTVNTTCFFSDLRGFTRLSEQLGPERTRNVLNPYLESVSRILLDRGAIVNKFIGDGIFAFFNAPIRECPEHARKACEAALASVDKLQELNQNLARQLGDESLAVRIGVSTGAAFVGDYGSEMKLDYTCIGDAVNLGARMEKANKSLGTAILVDDQTRRSAGDGFAFRPIGLIVVAGRSAPVDVHELAGYKAAADAAFTEFSQALARAIAHYQSCEWDSCAAALTECRALRTDDRVVALYARSLETVRRLARPPAWDGAIRLGTEDAGQG